MSVEHTAVVSPIVSTWTSTDAPRLHGRWLFLVRAAWVAVAALAIGISVAGMPYEMSILRRVCTAGGDACLEYLTPDMVQVLWELGLPASFYAWYATVAGLIFASVWVAVALIIFTRRSDNPMALLVALWLVIFDTFFSERPAALLAAHPAWWLPIQFVRFLTGTCLFLCCYLFPDGRFVPHWTRWVALVIGVQMAANFLFPESSLAPGHWLPEMVGLPAFVGLLSSLLFAQVYRYRYISTPVQRQQTKWVVFGIGTTLLAFMSLIFVPRICFPSLFQPGRAAGVFGFAFLPLLYMSLLPLPLSLGIALLRGRLWDIDILINRTLVYATLTACIVGVYILIVGVLGAVLQTHGNLLVSLVATGVVAVLFHPLRERLQRTVNRLMYGERDDPYQVISRLGRRLEATLEPGTVLPRVVETVKEALKLPYVAVRLKHDDRLGPAASAGIAPPDLWRLPVV